MNSLDAALEVIIRIEHAQPHHTEVLDCHVSYVLPYLYVENRYGWEQDGLPVKFEIGHVVDGLVSLIR